MKQDSVAPAASGPLALDGPLPGTICETFVRCGNPRCRCQQGRPHGPYYYRVWREGERVHKEYVKRSERAVIGAACDENARYRTRLREIRQERERLAASIRKHGRAAVRKAAAGSS